MNTIVIYYLGTWINNNSDSSKEAMYWVEIDRTRYVKMRKMFSNFDLSLELITKILKCYVLSILSNGMEAWT